jgi:uncharacterized glyoxalase superfamily protein PhnB
MAVSYKPAEHQNVIPYLVVPDAEKEVRLLKEVFDATEMHVSRDPQGGIAHASLKVGDSANALRDLCLRTRRGRHLQASLGIRSHFRERACRSILRRPQRRRAERQWGAVVAGNARGRGIQRRNRSSHAGDV